MNTEYKEILGDLGIERPEDGPLTDLELQQIFVSMGEGLLVN